MPSGFSVFMDLHPKQAWGSDVGWDFSDSPNLHRVLRLWEINCMPNFGETLPPRSNGSRISIHPNSSLLTFVYHTNTTQGGVGNFFASLGVLPKPSVITLTNPISRLYRQAGMAQLQLLLLINVQNFHLRNSSTPSASPIRHSPAASAMASSCDILALIYLPF